MSEDTKEKILYAMPAIVALIALIIAFIGIHFGESTKLHQTLRKDDIVLCKLW